MWGHLPGWSAVQFGVALCLSTLLTWGIKRFLIHRNLTKKATEDRWHTRPVPVFGGVAVYLAFAVCTAIFVPFSNEVLLFLGLVTLIFLTGFIDDLKRISPPMKLTMQIAAASILVARGYALPVFGEGFEFLDKAISFFLIVGLTNSFNLLDNMDGLSAGVASIVLLFGALIFGHNGAVQETILAVVLMGAAVGFLVHNFNPASIFMGDCGSLVLGFGVSSLFVMFGSRGTVGLDKTLLLMMLLAIPFLDTFFVSITRKIRGQKISQGGRDHLSHRLVKAGLSERTAVLLLWGIAGVAGLTAYTTYVLRAYQIATLLVSILVLFGTLFARYLAKGEKGLGDPMSDQSMTIVKIFNGYKYKRYVLQIGIDSVCMVLAYGIAYRLRFPEFLNSTQLHNMRMSVFITVPSVLVFLAIMGVYRGTWRYIGITDLLKIYGGVALGSIFAMVALTQYLNFYSFSKSVVIIHGLLLTVLLPGTRTSYRLFDELVYLLSDRRNLKRTLIYGAGDNGEMLARSMHNVKKSGRLVVGYIDDDPATHMNAILGAKVFGALDMLPEVLRKKKIDEVVVSSSKISAEKQMHVQECAKEKNIDLLILENRTIKVQAKELKPAEPALSSVEEPGSAEKYAYVSTG